MEEATAPESITESPKKLQEEDGSKFEQMLPHNQLLNLQTKSNNSIILKWKCDGSIYL